MGMFGGRRRQGPPSSSGPRDEWLPTLSLEQARAFAVICREYFLRRGDETIVERGVITLADGHQFGLHNLSVQVAAAPFEQWRQTVAEHFDVLLDTRPDATLDPSTLYLKLRAVDQIPDGMGVDALEPLPGVAALLDEDEPSIVRELFGPDARLAAIADPRAVAMANLRDLPAPDHAVLHADENDPTSAVHTFETPDFFGASRVLVLPELLATIGARIPATGVLVAVPNRHVLAVHLLTGTGVVAAGKALAQMALALFEDAGSITSSIFHLTPDLHAQVFGEQTGDGYSLTVSGQVEDAFAALGLIE